MKITPAQLGFLRGLGFVLFMAFLTFLGNSANLTGIVSFSIAGFISTCALSLEHYLSAKSGTTALFGAVSIVR